MTSNVRNCFVKFLLSAKYVSEYRRSPNLPDKLIDDLMVELGCERDVWVLTVQWLDKNPVIQHKSINTTVEYILAKTKEEAIKEFNQLKQSQFIGPFKIINIQRWRRGR
jgi:hypothetical protein